MTELTQNWSVGKGGHRHPSMLEQQKHDKLMLRLYTEERMEWVMDKGFIVDYGSYTQRLAPLMKPVVKYIGRGGNVNTAYPRNDEEIQKELRDNPYISYADGYLRLAESEALVKWRPEFLHFYKRKVDVCLDELDATLHFGNMLSIKRYMEYQFGEIGSGFMMWWYFTTGGKECHKVHFGQYGKETIKNFERFSKGYVDIDFTYAGAPELTDRKNKYFDAHQKYVRDSWRKSENKHA